MSSSFAVALPVGVSPPRFVKMGSFAIVLHDGARVCFCPDRPPNRPSLGISQRTREKLVFGHVSALEIQPYDACGNLLQIVQLGGDSHG